MANLMGYLIDVENGYSGPVMIEPELDAYYRRLSCRVIDIVERLIDGKLYDIVCDDEALLKEEPILSAINAKREPMLAGNLLVLGLADGDGEQTSLTAADVTAIQEKVVGRISGDGSPIRPLLICEYAE